ncbi:hypothetical protein LTR47_007377 [Exophiala xenobiotica]|nr:hypothetical protein LTR41_009805 [Exophiala xenobiotica]KAK5230523.1 hypothetical protein LTR47_007377 [Exophiala xenobiotica]KAK5248960.1 hypothetical protein LTS06_006026 [Exophiala xenobiotica]KAK5344911.1 hypothetical protein LTR61_011314 [Exophiala xenobiotica]KAK5363143.1 hypothetical protein LTR11_009222 [Exophiala xenobiotica]
MATSSMMYPRWVLSQFLKEDMVGAQTRALIGCTVDELHETEWTALKEMYRQFTRHEIGQSDKDFQNEIEELFADSIATGAEDAKVAAQYAATELLVVDEAARVVKYELWPLLASY